MRDRLELITFNRSRYDPEQRGNDGASKENVKDPVWIPHFGVDTVSSKSIMESCQLKKLHEKVLQSGDGYIETIENVAHARHVVNGISEDTDSAYNRGQIRIYSQPFGWKLDIRICQVQCCADSEIRIDWDGEGIGR